MVSDCFLGQFHCAFLDGCKHPKITGFGKSEGLTCHSEEASEPLTTPTPAYNETSLSSCLILLWKPKDIDSLSVLFFAPLLGLPLLAASL